MIGQLLQLQDPTPVAEPVELQSAPCVLQSLIAQNLDEDTTFYLQVHNVDAEPAGDAVPVFSVAVPPGEDVSYRIDTGQLGLFQGMPLRTGCWLAWSTALETLQVPEEAEIGPIYAVGRSWE